MVRKALLLMGLCSIGWAVAQAAPEPRISADAWELTIRYEDPKRVSVYVPGEEKPIVYWYMLYKVVNEGRDEVEFYPDVQIVTDALDVVHAERQVSPEAFRAIQRRAQDPLLTPPHKMAGVIRRGKDRAKHGVAIWRDFNENAKNFTVFFAGLSGETQRVKNPAFDEESPESDENPRYFVLRKTLAVPYKLPASPQARRSVEPERVLGGQKWILR